MAPTNSVTYIKTGMFSSKETAAANSSPANRAAVVSGGRHTFHQDYSHCQAPQCRCCRRPTITAAQVKVLQGSYRPMRSKLAEIWMTDASSHYTKALRQKNSVSVGKQF